MGKKSRSKMRRQQERKDVEKFGAQKREEEERQKSEAAALRWRDRILNGGAGGPPLLDPEHFKADGIANRNGVAIALGFLNVDAYRLALYATDDGSRWEWIWNSRDGVTPFIVGTREGDGPSQKMKHCHYSRDRFVLFYRPQPGDRVFVSMTRESAREAATRTIEFFWDAERYPARERYASKEEGIAMIADSYFEDGNRPDLITVGPEGWPVDRILMRAAEPDTKPAEGTNLEARNEEALGEIAKAVAELAEIADASPGSAVSALTYAAPSLEVAALAEAAAKPAPRVRYIGERMIDGSTKVRRISQIPGTATFLDLPPRLELRNHSPTGFEWGFGGSGPAQLALALVADATGSDSRALEVYQIFKWDQVRKLPRDRWELTQEEIVLTVARLEGEQKEGEVF